MPSRTTISENALGSSAAATSATSWLRMPRVSSRVLGDAERPESQRAAARSSAASIPSGRSPRPFRFCCRRRVSRSPQASPRSARSSASTCSPRFSRSAASFPVWPRPASSSTIVAGASSFAETAFSQTPLALSPSLIRSRYEAVSTPRCFVVATSQAESICALR